jgi:hypothetical protein
MDSSRRNYGEGDFANVQTLQLQHEPNENGIASVIFVAAGGDS